MVDLRQRLAEPGIIIMDGATGTQLQQMGLPPGMAPELWNLKEPEKIKQHYRVYVEAGCDAILTNSFGGTRPRLDMEQSGHLTHDVNVAAARLAREVAGDKVIVMGSMGPTGLLMEPMGELTYETAKVYFAEQAIALAEGGVDSLHIETLSDLQEVTAAIAGAQEATGLPVTATMSFDMHGRTMMGVSPAEAVKALWCTGVVAVGVNCGNTLKDNLEAITAMRTAMPDAVLIAKPNAGLPHTEDGIEVVYDVTPAIMAEYACKFAFQRVKMMGGCCGSTPAHLVALREAIAGYTPPTLDEVLAANGSLQNSNGRSTNGRERRRERRRERA